MSLTEIIKQRIIEQGPISFHDFMEMALYYPCLGYYTSGEDKIGEKGDYYTSPYMTSIFGEMIGNQLEEMWCLMGKNPFTIVEYGAGTGALCNDVLKRLKKNTALYDGLQYCIIEKSAAMREKEKSILQEKVSWYDSIHDIAGVTGCVLSNELLDNFSVHVVVMKEELMEVFVDNRDGFIELLKPAPDTLKDYLDQLNITLPYGFRTEINIEAIEWLKDISVTLKKGFVLTIDYGFPSAELYREYRRNGTLVCYNKHRVSADLYNNVGRQDITAHVNFSALCSWGRKHGLESCGYTNQAHFLHGLGLVGYLKEFEEDSAAHQISNKERDFLLQTFLMDMGNKFKVLIQHKGIDRPMLSGLRFSRQYA